MSVSGQERGPTNNTDIYDHAIKLLDKSNPNLEAGEDNYDKSSPPSVLQAEIGKPLERQWTKGYLRKELARRKYARWQEGEGADAAAVEANDVDSTTDTTQKKASKTDAFRKGRLSV